MASILADLLMYGLPFIIGLGVYKVARVRYNKDKLPSKPEGYGGIPVQPQKNPPKPVDDSDK